LRKTTLEIAQGDRLGEAQSVEAEQYLSLHFRVNDDLVEKRPHVRIARRQIAIERVAEVFATPKSLADA